MHDREKLSLYIDGLLEPREKAEVEGHLAACSECRGYVDDLKMLAADMKDLPPATPPAGISEAVMRELKRSMLPEKKSGFLLIFPRLALAAGFFLCLAAIFYHFSGNSQKGMVASRSPERKKEVAMKPPSPEGLEKGLSSDKKEQGGVLKLGQERSEADGVLGGAVLNEESPEASRSLSFSEQDIALPATGAKASKEKALDLGGATELSSSPVKREELRDITERNRKTAAASMPADEERKDGDSFARSVPLARSADMRESAQLAVQAPAEKEAPLALLSPEPLKKDAVSEPPEQGSFIYKVSLAELAQKDAVLFAFRNLGAAGVATDEGEGSVRISGWIHPSNLEKLEEDLALIPDASVSAPSGAAAEPQDSQELVSVVIECVLR